MFLFIFSTRAGVIQASVVTHLHIPPTPAPSPQHQDEGFVGPSHGENYGSLQEKGFASYKLSGKRILSSHFNQVSLGWFKMITKDRLTVIYLWLITKWVVTDWLWTAGRVTDSKVLITTGGLTDTLHWLTNRKGLVMTEYCRWLTHILKTTADNITTE